MISVKCVWDPVSVYAVEMYLWAVSRYSVYEIIDAEHTARKCEFLGNGRVLCENMFAFL